MLSPKTALALLLFSSMASAGDFNGRHALAARIPGARNGLGIRADGDASDSSSPASATSVTPDEAETTADADPTTSAAPEPSTTAAAETTAEPTTQAPETTKTPDATTPATTAAPTTAPTPDATKTTPSTSDETEEQSTVTRKQTTQGAIITAAPTTSTTSSKAQPTTLFSTQDYTTIIVTKGADGQDQTSTKVQQTLVPTATAAPIDSQPQTESGMSKQTKTTVIGVVCGVGGAILLAGIFFVWWKWSSRRKQRAAIDDGDELVGMNAFQPSGMGSHSEKHTAGGGQAGLFKDNLDSYHQPGNQRPANAGTNF